MSHSNPERPGLRAFGQRLGPVGIAAGTLAVVATAVAVAMLPGLIGAALTPAPAPVALPADAASDRTARMAGFVAQIDGRTMFFVPAKPPPKPVVETNPDRGPPPPPPPPSTYGGPAPFAMVFDTVWFADGQRLKAGEAGTGGLEVVRLEPPWAVVVRWKEVEFTVKVFDRDTVVLKARNEKMVEGTPPDPVVPPPAVEPTAAEGVAPSEPGGIEPESADERPVEEPTEEVPEGADPELPAESSETNP